MSGHFIFQLFIGSLIFERNHQPELLAEIMLLNKPDTVENPGLVSRLDANGYLTVYRGHCKRNVRNANSWSLDVNGAIKTARMFAWIYQSPDFYVVTGKIKLEDIIAYNNFDTEHEIVVLNRNVSGKSKKTFYVDPNFEAFSPVGNL